MGRPTVYTEQIATEVCTRLSAGETLRGICRSEHIPPAPTVRGWVVDNLHGFAERYARARTLGLDELAEETIDIADETSRDTVTDKDGNERANTEWISRSKLRVDTRRWLLSKLNPGRYGDMLKVESDALSSIAAGLADARKRAGDG